MSGVVFIITFPTEEHENFVKTIAKKKVVIVESKNTTHELFTCTPLHKSEEVFDKFIQHDSPIFVSPIPAGYEYSSMEKLIKDILVIHKLECTACYHQIDDNYKQVVFSVEEGDKCEEILDVLKEHNVGQMYESTISIIPCSLYHHAAKTDEVENTGDIKNTSTNTCSDTAWVRFVNSVRARLTVAQLVEVLKADASITFEFFCLLTIAATLCAMGLVEDNDICLFCSMFICPLMGPVLAGTFGYVIRDNVLQITGMQSELFGIGLATLVGFIYGTIICCCTDKYGPDWQPSVEMLSRGDVYNLGSGCLGAVLSGAAVAIAILSRNFASLVGVAISISLMPPAVNAGLLWSLATIFYISDNGTLTNHEITNKYRNLLLLGAISMCLTLVNIICIYLSGILIFKIKEVAPVKMKNEHRRQFWKHDVRITRDYNKTLQKEEANAMQAQLNELKRNANLQNPQFSPNVSKDSREKSLPRSLDAHKSAQSVNSCTIVSKRPTIQELQDLYRNLTRENVSMCSNYSGGSTKHLAPLIERDCMASPQLMTEVVISNSGVENSRVEFGTTKKFTVTPCILDM